MNALFFWFFSVGMIVCALAVIFNRNAVASALCFTFTIVFMAGLFVMLSAFFLAAVQILVTAGAVMVLFLFIIMLLDLTAMEHMPRQKIWMACSALLALGFLALVAKTLQATLPPTAERSAPPDTRPQRPPWRTAQPAAAESTRWTTRTGSAACSSPRTLRRPTITSYVAPFEITSLLILVATVGVIVLCKQDESPARIAARKSPAKRRPSRRRPTLKATLTAPAHGDHAQ